MEPTCVTGKMCFPSKREALTFGLSVKRRKKQKEHIAAYICSDCHYWHLTSGTTAKHKKLCTRVAIQHQDKYRGNDLKAYMFNGTNRPKKKKTKR
jgi:hypothetical protein